MRFSAVINGSDFAFKIAQTTQNKPGSSGKPVACSGTRGRRRGFGADNGAALTNETLSAHFQKNKFTYLIISVNCR